MSCVGERGLVCFFFSSRRRHTRFDCDWSSDVCSSDLVQQPEPDAGMEMMTGLCGALAPPTTAASCVCGQGMTCAVNGCYGGWYCNTKTEKGRGGEEGRSRGGPVHLKKKTQRISGRCAR